MWRWSRGWGLVVAGCPGAGGGRGAPLLVDADSGGGGGELGRNRVVVDLQIEVLVEVLQLSRTLLLVTNKIETEKN